MSDAEEGGREGAEAESPPPPLPWAKLAPPAREPRRWPGSVPAGDRLRSSKEIGCEDMRSRRLWEAGRLGFVAEPRTEPGREYRCGL